MKFSSIVPDLPPPPPIDPFFQEMGNLYAAQSAEKAARIGEVAKEAEIRETWKSKQKPPSDVLIRRVADGRRNMRTLLSLPKDPLSASVDLRAGVPFGGKLTYYPNYIREAPRIPQWLGGESKLTPVLNIDFVRSPEKGSAYKAFQKLTKISEKTGRPIYSDTIIPQYSKQASEIRPSLNRLVDVSRELGENATTYDVLKKDFPQLRYRETPNLKTTGKYWANIYPEMSLTPTASVDVGPKPYRIEGTFKSLSDLRSQMNKIPKGSLFNPNTQVEFYNITSKVKPSYGKNLLPAARQLGAALGTEAASVGGMALRGAGRLAGPVGWAMTAYDLAQAFPAPAPISEEDMGKALRSYRTGPQPQFAY